MDIVRQSLAIAVVFALLWTALWLLRKKGWTVLRRTKPAQSLLESRGKLALSAHHSIHLVQIGDRSLILALHPDGVTFLGDAAPLRDSQRKELAAT
ncbi:MAG: flagellar biosynthetic protein FliO [Bryobacteraceae bacterium]|jgi:flagellar biogenesis protein FliO